MSPLDVAVYHAARRAYAHRCRAQAAETAARAVIAPVATMAVPDAAAIVAEWEGLSYSDRAIDSGYGGMTAYVLAHDALISQRAA